MNQFEVSGSAHRPPVLLALLTGAPGALFWKISSSMGKGENGLLPRFYWPYLLVWGFSAAVLVALLVLSRKCRGGLKAPFSDRMARPGICVGGILVVLSSVIRLLQGGADAIGTLASIGLVAAGGILVLLGALRSGEQTPPQGLLPIPGAVLLVALLDRFRTWGVDPQVSDYSFLLLAAVFSMLAAYHLCYLQMKPADPDRTAFTCSAALFFCVLSLPNASVPQAMLNVGLALWFLLGIPNAALEKPESPEA